MPQYEVTLSDGRRVIFEENSEEAATRAAERWEGLNPSGEPINYYEVELESGETKRIPAVSEDAATQFAAAWGPEARARADAQARQAGAAGVTLGGQPKAYDATMNAVNSASLGLDKIIGAAGAAGVTGLQNLMGDGPGYGMADAFNASRQAQNDAQREYQGQAMDGGLLSGLAGGLAMTGGTALGQFVKGGGNLGGQALRAGLVSAPVGAVSGLLNSDPGQELESTGQGAIIGGVTGAAVPVAARTATGAARTFGTPIRQGLNTLTGGNIPGLRGGGADRQAMQRLADAMRLDGLDQQQVRTVLNTAMTRGVDTNLLDVVGRNATRTRALIQGAAMKPGPAQTLAGQYRDEVAGGLQDRAINRAYELTPGETRSAQQYGRALDETQDQLAANDYAPIYDQRVPVTNEIERALEGVPGQLEAARRGSAFRFPERAQEIEGLYNADEIVDDVSAGTLDRIQRRLGQSGRNAQRSLENPDNDLAADYYARQGSLNDELAAIPELAPARATYRGYQTAQDATDLGSDALMPNMRPADYADQLARLQGVSDEAIQTSGRQLPTAQQAAGVGLRDQIVNKIGNLGDGSTGLLNRLSSAPNPTQVLDTTYGQQGRAFQEDIGGLVESLNNARFIDPTTGSPTASRLGAEDLVDNIPTSVRGGLLAIINKVRRGATLTDAEREAIVRLSTRPLTPAGIPAPVNRSSQISGALSPILAARAGG